MQPSPKQTQCFYQVKSTNYWSLWSYTKNLTTLRTNINDPHLQWNRRQMKMSIIGWMCANKEIPEKGFLGRLRGKFHINPIKSQHGSKELWYHWRGDKAKCTIEITTRTWIYYASTVAHNTIQKQRKVALITHHNVKQFINYTEIPFTEMDSAKYDTQLSFVYIVSRVSGQILEYRLFFFFSFHLTWQGITFVWMRRNISGSTLKFISCFVWKFHFPSFDYEHNLVTFLECNLKKSTLRDSGSR